MSCSGSTESSLQSEGVTSFTALAVTTYVRRDRSMVPTHFIPTAMSHPQSLLADSAVSSSGSFASKVCLSSLFPLISKQEWQRENRMAYWRQALESSCRTVSAPRSWNFRDRRRDDVRGWQGAVGSKGHVYDQYISTGLSDLYGMIFKLDTTNPNLI